MVLQVSMQIHVNVWELFIISLMMSCWGVPPGGALCRGFPGIWSCWAQAPRRSRGQTPTNKSSLPRDSQPVQIKHLGMTWWCMLCHSTSTHETFQSSAGMALGEAAQGSQPGRAHTSCMCGVGNGELVPWFQDFGCSKNLKTMYTITVYSDCTNSYSCVDRRFRRFQVLFRCSSLICALERTWSHESLPKNVHV